MANRSKMGRKEQVLNRLVSAEPGEWIDGTDLATEVVGGSEGLKRLRELRAQGIPIEERPHPSPNRSIWQYRLKPGTTVSSVNKAARALGMEEAVGLAPEQPAMELADLRPAPVIDHMKPVDYVCPKCGRIVLDLDLSYGADFARGRCPTHKRVDAKRKDVAYG